jgi:hypothetical protein
VIARRNASRNVLSGQGSPGASFLLLVAGMTTRCLSRMRAARLLLLGDRTRPFLATPPIWKMEKSCLTGWYPT